MAQVFAQRFSKGVHATGLRFSKGVHAMTGRSPLSMAEP